MGATDAHGKDRVEHTRRITHLSKPSELAVASSLSRWARVTVMRSVEEREEAMSAALPLRLGDVCEDAAQFLEVEVLVRDARIEPARERLSAVLVANEAAEAAREGVDSAGGSWIHIPYAFMLASVSSHHTA